MALGNHRQGELITGINVTPLVDVVLVLLIVLMVTASYAVSNALPLDLPGAATGESTGETLTISIMPDGSLFLDGQPTDPPRLREALRKARRPDTRAMIAADGAVRHRRVVRVMDLLRGEGITRFSINVDPRTLANLQSEEEEDQPKP